MNKIEIIENGDVVSACFKSVDETDSWIAQCESEELWGKIGSYSIKITDATLELETLRLKNELVSKQSLDTLLGNKQATGNYITALTGDVTAIGPNSANATLSNTGVTAGTYSLVTVDTKGRVTAGSDTGSISRFSYVNNATVTNSNATYTTVVALTTVSLSAGLYSFRFFGIAQSGNNSNGIGVRISNVSATVTTIQGSWQISQAANGTAQKFQYDQIATNTNVTSASVQAANANFSVVGEGVFRVTVAGTVAIQLRSELNGTASSLLAGSYLEVTLV